MLDRQHVEMSERITAKKAKLIAQMKRTACTRMNELVDRAFAKDMQLRKIEDFYITEDYPHTAYFTTNDTYVDDEGNDQWYEEWECSLDDSFFIENLDSVEEATAVAVQTYIIDKYLAKDPITKYMYRTSKINNPEFTRLKHPYFIKMNIRCNGVNLALKKAIRGEGNKRRNRLATWVVRTQLQRQYAPGSETFKKLEEKFNQEGKLMSMLMERQDLMASGEL